MTNLLRANLFRLRRDLNFWCCFGTVLACSAGFMFFWCREDLALGLETSLEQYYFRMTLPLGMFDAIVSALFLNVEYSEGAIRNKLAVGHTRRSVYWAHFLTILAASLLIALAWLLGGCVGIPMVGAWSFGVGAWAFHVLIVMAASASFAAIFTFLGMLTTGRAATVGIVLVYFALLLGAAYVDNILSEPEFMSNFLTTVDGTAIGAPEPNPYYVSGAARAFYEFLQDLLPTGQTRQLQTVSVLHPVRSLLCDAGVTAVFTLGGLALFGRKDLK